MTNSVQNEVKHLPKIKIVTDSTADIPKSISEKLHIDMVPLKVHFGEQSFMDAVTIDSDEFYSRLKRADKLPTTSQPSPSEFAAAFKKILQDDPQSEIISIHLSSALSGTYQSAVLAKSLLEDLGERITIIDSKTACYGIGVLVVAAAEAVNQGAEKAEVLNLIASMRSETGLFFLVDTLEFLQKGGRIGKAAALFGTLLQIKPILTIDRDGEVAAVDKVRGQRKAMMHIIQLLKQQFADVPVKLAIAHAQAEQTAQELAALMDQHFEVKDVLYSSIGSVIGTHVGPGTVAIFVNKVQ
ncbi:EDD domain protein [Candidatus Peribacteria bacterium RIFOXYA1_FULL_56_14]|nr:MAG: EDD domain protein [Candidatus Peribacteria bacterium RIFOXYA1_FULL_56_14]